MTIVIPAYNEERRIGECLDRVTACARDAQIIVVVNGSTDATARIASSYPGVTVVELAEKGLGIARQAGLERAGGEFLVSLDADTLLTDSWLARAESLLSAHPDAACVSGPYDYYDLPFAERWTYALVMRAWGLWRDALGLVQLTGGNSMYRTSLLRAAGGFATDTGFDEEDLRLALRLRRYGKIIFTQALASRSSGRRLAQRGFFRVTSRRFMDLIAGNAGRNLAVAGGSADYR